MTWVTTPGSEIIDRCGARTSVTRACACLAMASCSAGGMTRSAVPTTAQDGMVFQAGMPDFWPSAMVDSGSWVAASTLASAAGRPLAKQDGNRLCLTYASNTPAGAPGYVARLKIVVGSAATTQEPGTAEASSPTVCPLSGAKAST